MESNPASRRLREAPPRHLNLFTKATVLFGGFLQQFGWLFFIFGSFFCWIFIPLTMVDFWPETGVERQEIKGEIVSVEITSATINNSAVYSCLYTFEVNGERYTGKGFAPGQKYQSGDEIAILYNTADPGDSRAPGLERSLFPPWSLLVLIFPLTGLAFIIYSLKNNWKAVKLLQNGTFTRGKLVNKEMTNTKINNLPVYKFEFEFNVGRMAHTAVCKTHLSQLVEDEEQEIILYDNFNPDYNVVYDAEGIMPAITEDGELKTPSLFAAAYLLLPLSGIGLNLLFLWTGFNIFNW